jgi:hypothetical protein
MDKYFPKIDNIDMTKLQISDIGKFSISKPQDAEYINNIILLYMNTTKITITDATANNGGNTINFSLMFDKINSVEISKVQFDILQNNVNVYNLKNITLYNENYLNIMFNLQQDVIFIDGPWGGIDYKKKEFINIYLDNLNLVDLIKQIYNNKCCKICVLKVPKNYNFIKLFSLDNIIFHVHSLTKFIIIVIKI